jgi:hypothetical protein
MAILASAQVPNLVTPVEFAGSIERQRELIATIATAVDIKPNK